MRLAFLADASLPHAQRWVDFFVGRGHDCLLLSLEPGEGYRCPVHWLPARTSLPHFMRYTFAIPEARRHLEDFRPDLINAHFLPNYGWMVARMGIRPFVLSVLGSDMLTVPQTSPLHRSRTHFVLGQTDFVISDAEMLSKVVREYGFPSERILTVPLGIESQRFASIVERSQQPPYVVLSTRRLDPIYDVATLLRAVSRLEDDASRNLLFRVAGTGSLTRELRAQAATTRVAFLGWLTTERLDAELARAHFYVSTSRSDSTSVSLLEAMAAGCFPVVTDIEGNREWVRDGENGLLFPVGDDAALARCLLRAVADPALRLKAAERNRQCVQERATWQTNMQEVQALFARLCRPI